jgi:hypothetical protein
MRLDTEAAPAGDSNTGRGLALRLSARVQEGTTIMTDQPARVTPGEISDLLDHARQMISGASLEEQIAYHERKALLLSRVAADLDTAEAHLVAAEAWHYVRTLAARRDAPPEEEAR